METFHDIVPIRFADGEFLENGDEDALHLGLGELVEADGEMDSGLNGRVEGFDPVGCEDLEEVMQRVRFWVGGAIGEQWSLTMMP